MSTDAIYQLGLQEKVSKTLMEADNFKNWIKWSKAPNASVRINQHILLSSIETIIKNAVRETLKELGN